MKTIALAATVVVLSAVVTSAQFVSLHDPSKPLSAEQVQEWARAVAKHEKGQADEAANSIAAWSGDQLYLLFNELRALSAFQKNPLILASRRAASRRRAGTASTCASRTGT